MPNSPTIHIQKTAPGPPSATATHARDVAEPDRRRQRRRERLEVVDRARVVLVVVRAGDDLGPVRQRLELAEAAPEREEHTHPEHDVEHIVVPDHAVEDVEKVPELLHEGAPAIGVC
jgi:hypothetical protein